MGGHHLILYSKHQAKYPGTVLSWLLVYSELHVSQCYMSHCAADKQKTQLANHHKVVTSSARD